MKTISEISPIFRIFIIFQVFHLPHFSPSKLTFFIPANIDPRSGLSMSNGTPLKPLPLRPIKQSNCGTFPAVKTREPSSSSPPPDASTTVPTVTCSAAPKIDKCPLLTRCLLSINESVRTTEPLPVGN